MARSAQRQGEHGGFGPNRHAYKNSNDFTTFFFANFPNGYGELDISRFLEGGLGLKKCLSQEDLTNGGEGLGLLDFLK